MAQWNLSNLVALLLDTQTDADSPVSEALMKTIRWTLESLMILAFGEGTSGTVDSVSTTTMTDAALGATTDEHNGRTLLITSGNAKGFIYNITDTTTTTVVCGADNLETDGVAATDGYRIFYDLTTNTDGHDHDGVNSKEIDVPRQLVPMGGPVTTTSTSIGNVISRAYWYKKSDQTSISYKLYTVMASGGGSCRVVVGSVTGSTHASSATPAEYTGTLDVSGEAADTWIDVEVQAWTATGLTQTVMGVSFHIT